MIITLIAGLTFILVACSSDKDNKRDPQIISSSAGSGEGHAGGASVTSFAHRAVRASRSRPALPGSPSQASVATSSRGVTVRRTETGVVPADDAYVVVLSQAAPIGPGGPIGVISSRNQAELIKALEAIGVKKEDLWFDLGGAVGPFSSVAVHTPLQSINDQGVSFEQNCEAVLLEARKQAFADAKRSAEALAGVAGRQAGCASGPQRTAALDAGIRARADHCRLKRRLRPERLQGLRGSRPQAIGRRA